MSEKQAAAIFAVIGLIGILATVLAMVSKGVDWTTLGTLPGGVGCLLAANALYRHGARRKREDP